jgi:hypothetical protein
MQHLLPNGRAFRTTTSKYLRKFFEGLTAALILPFRTAVDTDYQDLLPTTTTRLTDWQNLWGIMYPSATDPRGQLLAAWSYEGQPTVAHIQSVLQAAGFDVYVHEAGTYNPLDYIAPTTVNPLGTGMLGYPLVNKLFAADKNYSAVCGETGIECGEDEAACGYYQYSVWLPKLYVVPENSPYFVYIGGQEMGDLAFVDPLRRNEFEALCLKLVPDHLWIGMLVRYNEPETLFFLGDFITPPVVVTDNLFFLGELI